MEISDSNDHPSLLIGIGASAGGHKAIYDFFGNLPQDCCMTFVVIMHLAREHQTLLDKMISKHTPLKVQKIQSRTPIRKAIVYVLPENKYVKVEDNYLILVDRPGTTQLNVAIDLFFHSLGSQFKERSMAIIFSGLGSDGSRGIQTIEDNGGIVVVQSPESSDFKSMPNASIRADHPDYIASPAEIAKNIYEIIEYKNLKKLSK